MSLRSQFNYNPGIFQYQLARPASKILAGDLGVLLHPLDDSGDLELYPFALGESPQRTLNSLEVVNPLLAGKVLVWENPLLNPLEEIQFYFQMKGFHLDIDELTFLTDPEKHNIIQEDDSPPSTIEILSDFSTNLFMAPIHSSLLHTRHSKAQIDLKIGGHRALCQITSEDECYFQYYDGESAITDFQFEYTTQELTIQGDYLDSFEIEKISFGKVNCAITSSDENEITAVCEGAYAGRHQPIVNTDTGNLKLADEVKDQYLQVDLVIDQYYPSAINIREKTYITFEGSGFPWADKSDIDVAVYDKSTYSIGSDDISANMLVVKTRAIGQSDDSGEIVITMEAENQSTIVINLSVSQNEEDVSPEIILIEPDYVSPVEKQDLLIQGKACHFL